MKLRWLIALLLVSCKTSESAPLAASFDLPRAPPAPSRPYGTIAYTRGAELRTIEPDGSDDRLVWAAPPIPGGKGLTYTLSGPAWRPDGGEIAFSSDHEQAVSPYDRDIYAVRGDGANLRKLTNAPDHDHLGRFAKGTVTVLVQAAATGPYFIYVQGAPEPQIVTASRRVTFKDVADLGAVPQAVVAMNGANHWLGTPVDVQPGKTTDAGLLPVSAFGGIPDYHAAAPFWRADGKQVGYLGPLCQPASVPVEPPPGAAPAPLVAPGLKNDLCAADWGPTAATAGKLVVGTVAFDTEGRNFVYVLDERAAALPAPILTLDRFRRVTDLHWLPAGTGFVIARQDDLTDEDINLHEVAVPSGKTRQLTELALGGDKLRHFTMSPRGDSIVFERTPELLHGKSDLWIMRRDGSGLRKLVADAGYPAWNPVR